MGEGGDFGGRSLGNEINVRFYRSEKDTGEETRQLLSEHLSIYFLFAGLFASKKFEFKEV